ncbi:MAG: hypothetical protein LBU46_00890, partial [Candidatus Accumulibacter sp.]|nr:hypothetical protein [Accumulibacter sp.]
DDPNFFDDENNLEPFTGQQIERLRKRLAAYHYEFQHRDDCGEHFHNPENGTFALLTGKGLYFTAGFNEDEIFEVGMTASEFTDTGEFAKYDPQNDGWEEI